LAIENGREKIENGEAVNLALPLAVTIAREMRGRKIPAYARTPS
jgi:hypothetical protein